LVYDPDRLGALCERLGIRRVVLFGSRATGSPPPGPASDLDLAVSLVDPDHPTRFRELHHELSELFATESLDLASLDRADPLFRWEVVREGVLLWGDPLDYLEFRAFAFRDFVDSADLRRLERALFEKKLAYIRERLGAA
jgi:predicted nucleotidyltransferase